MPPTPRKPDPPPCRYPVRGSEECGQPATVTVVAATGTLAEDTPMCAAHAARFVPR